MIHVCIFFFFNDTATTEIYTLSLHDALPIFVPSHRPPGPSVANYPLVTYVTDGIESAMAQAKAAAGDRNVLVHGAYTAQRALEAGVLIELQIVQVIDTPEATHIRYRVRR